MIQPGTRLGQYEIRSALGRGGMGEVWRARDTKLGREVAVKTLPEEFAKDADRLARFEREARLLASLNHPNIAAIYGLEEHESTRFLVLELVEGETLADRIARGALTVDEALPIAFQIAGALETAHARGVIHRDLKPANIKVTAPGRVKVLDFGLAKGGARGSGLAEAATISIDASDATAPGTILGTPAYMSPEQARGYPTDTRTDIWSFGCVLYEMLTGRQTFPGPTTADIISALVTRDPRWELLPEATPHGLSTLLRRCLEKEVERRFLRVTDVREELQRATDSGRRAGAALEETARAILVLPFAAPGPSGEDEVFSDGLTEELITELARLEDLRVVPGAASFRLKNTPRTIPDLAREFGAGYVLTGRVRRAGASVRVHAELIDAGEDHPVWAERYTGTLEDVFDLQERISRGIAGSLKLRLGGATRREPDPKAQEAYLRGRHFFRQATASGMARAVSCYEEAVRIDPEYGPAFAALAEALVTLTQAWDARPARETMPRARAAAERALALDPHLAEAHFAMGLVATFYDWDRGRAESYFRRALELNPAYTEAARWYPALLIWLDTRYDEALEIVERGLEHDPNDPWLKVNRCWVYGFSRQFERWVEAARQLTAEEPFFGFGHYALGCALGAAGRHKDAIESFKRGIELDGRGSHHVGLLGWAYALDGQDAKARECLEELDALERRGRDVAVWKLHLHCGWGNADGVIRCLEQAIDVRSSATVFVLVHPFTDFIADEPRFHALLRKAGLGDLIGRRREPRWLPPRLRDRTPAAPSERTPSVAVLPFRNMSADPDNEYFGDGMAEEIINALSRVEGLRVTARTSAFAFKGKDSDIREIGSKLNVETLVEGGVRKAGDRIRVTVRLIDVATGYERWSERYDRKLEDVFAVQDDIAVLVAARLRESLSGALAQRSRPTGNLDAYEAYLKGRFYWNKGTPEGYRRSRECYERAIEQDPAFAGAYAGLAETTLYSDLFTGVSDNPARTKELARAALDRDPSLAEAHAILGHVLLFNDWDWEGAEKVFQRAIALNAGSASAHCSYLIFLANLGRYEEAVAEGRRTVELDPLWARGHQALQFAFLQTGQFAESIAHGRKALDLEPDFLLAQAVLAFALIEAGAYQDAEDALQAALRVSPGNSLAVCGLVWRHGHGGNVPAARRRLDDFLQAGGEASSPGATAVMFGWVGEHDSAFRCLERAVQVHDEWIPCIATMMCWNPLRSDPRFETFLRRLNFPEYSLDAHAARLGEMEPGGGTR